MIFQNHYLKKANSYKANRSAFKALKRKQDILKILAINGALFAVGIVIIELSFGGWLGIKTINRQNLLKDYNITVDTSHLYEDPNPIITYSRDKYGLRGTHTTPSSINILTVGGSTTDQRYIRDGETWQDVLQKKFAQSGETVIIGNAGVDGQSTLGHIMNFKWWFPYVPDLTPDFILFYIGLNDFYKELGYDDRLLLLRDDQSFNLLKSIRGNSALWHFARTLRRIYYARLYKIVHTSIDFKGLQWTKQALQDDYEFMQPRFSEYADRLRILADMTHRFGSKPIFVSQPSRKYRITPDGIEGASNTSYYEDHLINGVDYYHMMRLLDGVTKAVAIEKGSFFIDLSSHTGWADADFYDFLHMTPQGSNKVGSLLYKAIRNTILPGVEQKAPPTKE